MRLAINHAKCDYLRNGHDILPSLSFFPGGSGIPFHITILVKDLGVRLSILPQRTKERRLIYTSYGAPSKIWGISASTPRKWYTGRRILYVRRRDCVPSVELPRQLCLISVPALLVQRRLRGFGHAARHPDLLLPTLPRSWRRRTGGQLKTWATTIKAASLHHARWRKD